MWWTDPVAYGRPLSTSKWCTPGGKSAEACPRVSNPVRARKFRSRGTRAMYTDGDLSTFIHPEATTLPQPRCRRGGSAGWSMRWTCERFVRSRTAPRELARGYKPSDAEEAPEDAVSRQV